MQRKLKRRDYIAISLFLLYVLGSMCYMGWASLKPQWKGKGLRSPVYDLAGMCTTPLPAHEYWASSIPKRCDVDRYFIPAAATMLYSAFDLQDPGKGSEGWLRINNDAVVVSHCLEERCATLNVRYNVFGH